MDDDPIGARVCPKCDSPTEVRFCPDCGARTLVIRSDSDDAMIGRILGGRYRIEAVLGHGGMGIVYRATQVATNQTVAVKMIKADFAGKLDAVKRFHRETRAASMLSHPHTVKVFDFGQDDAGELFLVMEYLTGRTLSELISAAAPLPAERAVKLVSQIAGSLGEAHAAGLAHRDLKPDNIMLIEVVGDPDFVKVLDFGIAKFLARDSEESSTTANGVLVGTPYYMSPEQAQGLPDITPATDIYSLGAVLYEMLCGAKPFDGPSPLQILVAHANEQLPAVLPAECSAPPALRDLVHRMLAKKPSGRPVAAEVIELCAELVGSSRTAGRGTSKRDTLGGVRPAPVASTPRDDPLEPSRELERALPRPMSRRTSLAAAAVLLGLGVAALAYFGFGRSQHTGSTGEPVASGAPAPGNGEATDAGTGTEHCPPRGGMMMGAPMYNARSVDAAEDGCPAPSRHRDGKHGVIECHYGTVFFLRTEKGHGTCFERAQAVAERLNETMRAMDTAGGYLAVGKDHGRASIYAHLEDDTAPVRLVTVTRSDLVAYRGRSRTAGCDTLPDERLLAQWWRALLTDHYRVMTAGVEPIATRGTPTGAALDTMFRDARSICPGTEKIPMSVLRKSSERLSVSERDDLVLASYMVPCGWQPDAISLPR